MQKPPLSKRDEQEISTTFLVAGATSPPADPYKAVLYLRQLSHIPDTAPGHLKNIEDWKITTYAKHTVGVCNAVTRLNLAGASEFVSFGGCTALLETLEEYAKLVGADDAQIACCGAIAYLAGLGITKELVALRAVGDRGKPTYPIVNLLKKDLSRQNGKLSTGNFNSGRMIQSLKCISSLVQDKQNALMIYKAGGLPSVITALRQYGGENGLLDVAHHCCRALANFAACTSDTVPIILNIGALPLIEAALKNHGGASGSVDVASHGCRALANLSESDNNDNKAKVSATCLSVIISALQLYGGENGSLDVAHHCCRALANLAASNDDTVPKDIIKKGAVRFIEAALKNHGGASGSVDVASHGCRALANLSESGNNDNKPTVSTKCLSVIISALQQYGVGVKSIDVASHGCRALANLSTSPNGDTRDAILRNSGMDAIKNALITHCVMGMSIDVASHGCRAVANLAASANLVTINEIVEVVVTILRDHGVKGKSSDVASQSCRALANLLADADNIFMGTLLTEGRLSTVVDALVTHCVPVALQPAVIPLNGTLHDGVPYTCNVAECTLRKLVPALLAVLEAYGGESDVIAFYGFSALANLAARAPVKDALAKTDALTVVKKAPLARIDSGRSTIRNHQVTGNSVDVASSACRVVAKILAETGGDTMSDHGLTGKPVDVAANGFEALKYIATQPQTGGALAIVINNGVRVIIDTLAAHQSSLDVTECGFSLLATLSTSDATAKNDIHSDRSLNEIMDTLRQQGNLSAGLLGNIDTLQTLAAGVVSASDAPLPRSSPWWRRMFPTT